MDIFAALDLTDAQRARLASACAPDRLHVAGTDLGEETVADSFLASEVVFGNVPGGWLPRSAALRWVQLESVGFGEYRALDWATLGERVVMTNLAGFFADPVAETALAGILALGRGIDRLARLQSDRQWQGDPLRAELRTLAGASVVLFGRGSINRRLAELLRPFACTILTFGGDWREETLNAALRDADLVVSAVPETDATLNLFDGARLSLLKPTALFVNVGRGSAVDEEALAARLMDGRLGGAVLDVTRDEPLPAAHPLWACPNTILSQHPGGGTEDEIDRKIGHFAENLARYRAGARRARARRA